MHFCVKEKFPIRVTPISCYYSDAYPFKIQFVYFLYYTYNFNLFEFMFNEHSDSNDKNLMNKWYLDDMNPGFEARWQLIKNFSQ